jgi:hypothetical protein
MDTGTSADTLPHLIDRASYTCAKGWWFREEVTRPAGRLCGNTRQLHQRRDPQQLDADSSSIEDEIINSGNPAALNGGCSETNQQKVFIGPTRTACLNDPCVYDHTHTITVTPNGSGGTVVTTVNNQSTQCTY